MKLQSQTGATSTLLLIYSRRTNYELFDYQTVGLG
uniref:Uncharacterized protein n=1 Tax=Arundo donax TaxID=35708 RepID=A0A0A9C1W1_ARUDO